MSHDIESSNSPTSSFDDWKWQYIIDIFHAMYKQLERVEPDGAPCIPNYADRDKIITLSTFELANMRLWDLIELASKCNGTIIFRSNPTG